MCLRDYTLRSRPGIRLFICELISCTKARFLAFCMLLLLLGLASRLPAEEKEASLKLRGSTTYQPLANAAWLDEESSNLEARSAPKKLSTEFAIQDIVLLPDEILLLIRLPEYTDRHPGLHYTLPPKEELTCLFDNEIPTPLTGLDYSRGRALVRCRLTPKSSNNIIRKWMFGGGGAQSDLSLLNSHEVEHFSSVCLLQQSRVVAETSYGHVKNWQFLVFEVWATKKDVVLFAKGINMKQGHNVSPGELSCVFGGRDDAQVVETKVSMSAQEVFRCAHPPSEYRRSLMGKAVTLRWGTKLLPTVAYYEEFSTTAIIREDDGAPATPQQIYPAPQAACTAPVKEICICTMVFNVAKFLPEWGTFHSHVGVDRFILYDNNSEDELEEALRWLRDRQLQVSRYPWPWPKAQEAGFSHCVLASRQSCEWLLFADVDEFLFPAAHLPPSGKDTPIRQLIAEAERRGVPRLQQKHQAAADEPAGGPLHDTELSPKASDVPSKGSAIPRQPHLIPPGGHAGCRTNLAPLRVGQLSLICKDFGPSNLTQHPIKGVTQGYVCRSKQYPRHKSLVKLAAVSQDLQNVVHHFNLLPDYTTLTEHPKRAVVNHYKYQAWPEFRQKFRRRVSAYVADWKEQRNMGSQDRTPGLGARDLKPADWETAFCETLDTALRDYCRDTFAINSSTLTWQV